MLVFTHSEVGTGQQVIKLKLKIGTGFMTGVRSFQQTLRADVARFVIQYVEVHLCVLPSIRYFWYYCQMLVSLAQSSCF